MRSLALLIALVAASPLLAQAKKYALLVGVNKYQHAELNKPEPLQFAEADVRGLKDLLEKSGYTVTLLTGEKATLSNIRDGISELRKKGSGSAMVLAAFAGHGIQPEDSKDAYFCPYDADQAVFDRDGKKVADWDMKKTMLPLTEVIVNLKASGADSKAILVDACRNDPKTGRGRGFGTEFNVGDLPDNLALMLSCSKGERAWEDKAWDHGAFFHHVLKGLREGKGAIDGHVTANSLAAYVSRAVRTDVPAIIKGGATQRPHTIINGDVDFLIKLDPSAVPDPKVASTVPKPGEERDFEVGNDVTMRFCWVPGSNGKFRIGSPKREQEELIKSLYEGKRLPFWDNQNEHEVLGVDGFWMAKYEMTQSAYVKLTGKNNPSAFSPTGKSREEVKGLDTADFPVDSVSWDDAQACIKLMKIPKGIKKVSLPTEVQWDWAARGGKGNTQVYYWGDKEDRQMANIHGADVSVKVGSYQGKAPHPWGLCDIIGNVEEWCEDYYGNYSSLPAVKNPVQPVPQGTTQRVLRGSNFFSYLPTTAIRNAIEPDKGHRGTGFRVVLLP